MSYRSVHGIDQEEEEVVAEASPVRRSLGLDDLSTRTSVNSTSERSDSTHDVNIHGPPVPVNPSRDEVDLMIAQSQHRHYEGQEEFDKAVFLESRFAFTVTILSGIAAIMGFQFNSNPLFAINAEGCRAEATPSNQTDDTWYLIPNFGCCPRSGITLTCATSDTDDGNTNDCATEMLNCITFNNATEWQRWDSLNAEHGYTSHFYEDTARWESSAVEFFAIFQVVLATALAIVVGDMLLCILVIGPIYDGFRHLALRKVNQDLPIASYIDDRGWGAMRLEPDQDVVDDSLDQDTHGDSNGQHHHDHGEGAMEGVTMSRTVALIGSNGTGDGESGEVEMSNRGNTAAIVAIDGEETTQGHDDNDKHKEKDKEKFGGEQSILQIGLSDILTVHERLSAEDIVYDLEGQRVIHDDGEEMAVISSRSHANSATSSLNSPDASLRQDSMDGADGAASPRRADDFFGYDAILLHLGYTSQDKPCFDPNIHCKSQFREIVSRNYPFFKCCCILQLLVGIWLIEIWTDLHNSDMANVSAWEAYQLSSCSKVEFQQGRVLSDFHFICFVVFFTGVLMFLHCMCSYVYGKGLVYFCLDRRGQ
jgi:hypothetical protein